MQQIKRAAVIAGNANASISDPFDKPVQIDSVISQPPDCVPDPRRLRIIL